LRELVAYDTRFQLGVIDPTSAEEAAALSHVTVCMSVTPPASVLFFEHRGMGMRAKMLQDIVHVAQQRCALSPWQMPIPPSFFALGRCEEAAQALLASLHAARPADSDS
jgi:hypothetical protein